MRKNILKKAIALGTSVLMFFPGALPAFGASPSASNLVQPSASLKAVAFKDTSKHWGQAAIEKWADYGVVKGYNGSFRPAASVTRAEFAVMIDNIMKYINEGSNSFTDLNGDAWYYDSVLKLNTAGILSGTDGKALPEKAVSRQEAAVLIAGAFNVGSKQQTLSFTDNEQIALWAQDAVQSLVASSVMKGLPNGSFDPKADLTRAEAVTLFDNLIQLLITTEGDYSQDVHGNVVVNTPGVTLSNMTITGDLFVSEGVGEGEVTLNNVVIEGGVHVEGGGEHSIIFNNVDVKGALVVNKYNGQVRILATGSTKVSLTVLESGALLMTRELSGGGFEEVEIPADVLAGQTVKLDGNFNRVVNRSTQVQITAEGTIQEFTAEANTAITGNVNIVKAQGSATVLVNNAPVQPSGSVATPGSTTGNAATTAGSNGGTTSPGGNTGGGTGGGTQKVAVNGISLLPSSLTLRVGDNTRLLATVKPANATDSHVNWSVEGEGSSIIEVSAEGKVTAKAPGVATVKALTRDGGFFAQAVVTVQASELGISVSQYSGSVVPVDSELDEAIRFNSAQVLVKEAGKSLIQDNHYDVVLNATAPLEAGTVTTSVYAVVTLTGAVSGTPISDGSNVHATLNGQDYVTEFGNGITGESAASSFLLKLNIDQAEQIAQYKLKITREGYAGTSMTLTYRPQGAVSVTQIEAITGEAKVGNELTAGTVSYDGTPENEAIHYQWYRSDKESGFYQAIEGADEGSYTLTEADGGKFIRVHAAADEIRVSGSALSAAFGPIPLSVSPTQVFESIEAVYLGTNANANNIISNLHLSSSLPAYPGVTITWTSNSEQNVTAEGVVTRDSKDDKFVTLTAVLGGNAAGTKTYELIVRSTGTDNVGTGDYIDSYFTANYPQAYLKDGTIHVRYALNKPAELYMTVNVMNGSSKSDVKAVLEGHAGQGNGIIYVDKWPYFKVGADEVGKVNDFDTGVQVTRINNREARVEFVIVDESRDYTSANVTTIRFDQKLIAALDTTPPQPYMRYLNDARDTIYLYYNEKLDLTSVPAPEDFALNTGEVEAVSIHNNETSQWAYAPAYVKLKVNGISEQDISELKLSYIGNALQDLADARNKVQSYQNAQVSAVDAQLDSVTLSSDRTSMLVSIKPGWDPSLASDLNDPNEILSRFVIRIEGQMYNPIKTYSGYNTEYIEYNLKFSNPLPQGDAEVTFDTSGLIEWSMDAYPQELVSSHVIQIASPGIPTASYQSSNGELVLTFDPAFEFDYSSSAAGLVLKIDGKEHALRGHIVSPGFSAGKNKLIIKLNDEYSWKFKQAVENGMDVQIKYVKTNGEDQQQFTDAAGALLPDFNYVTVVK